MPRTRAEEAVMHALLRATALTAAVAGVLSCATPPHASASANNEYKWAILHGCDCGGIAYASGSAAPSGLGGQTLAEYVHDRAMHCASRQFVVTVNSGEKFPSFSGEKFPTPVGY